jgi:nucleotide-binding universal stress UspA family protein
MAVGRPDAEVVKLAVELGAGLTVVGSRGLGAYAGRSSAASPVLWSATPTVPCSW